MIDTRLCYLYDKFYFILFYFIMKSRIISVVVQAYKKDPLNFFPIFYNTDFECL